MKKAKIITTKNNDMILKSGELGKGKELYRVGFWPESFESESQALIYCMDEAKKNKINQVFIEDSCGGIYYKQLCKDSYGDLIYLEDEYLEEFLQVDSRNEIIN